MVLFTTCSLVIINGVGVARISELEEHNFYASSGLIVAVRKLAHKHEALELHSYFSLVAFMTFRTRLLVCFCFLMKLI